MSSWYALNVKYAEDDNSWAKPNTSLSHINVFYHPFEDRGFDLLFDTFRGDDEQFVFEKMIDFATWQQDPELLIAVTGSDTSDMFTFKEIDARGEVGRTWSNTPRGFWSEDCDHEPAPHKIAEETGAYPSRGGNYRDYE